MVLGEQEMRVSEPNKQFEDTPLVGVYPVPNRYSYWLGQPQQNSTSIDYTISASYYKKEKWNEVWLDNSIIEFWRKVLQQLLQQLLFQQLSNRSLPGFMKFEGECILLTYQ